MKPAQRVSRPAASAPRSDSFTSYARPIDSARELEHNGEEISEPRSWPRYFEFEGQVIDLDHCIFERGWIADAEGGNDE